MKRIAPNNQLPATHFVEVFTDGRSTNQEDFKLREVSDVAI